MSNKDIAYLELIIQRLVSRLNHSGNESIHKEFDTLFTLWYKSVNNVTPKEV